MSTFQFKDKQGNALMISVNIEDFVYDAVTATAQPEGFNVLPRIVRDEVPPNVLREFCNKVERTQEIGILPKLKSGLWVLGSPQIRVIGTEGITRAKATIVDFLKGFEDINRQFPPGPSKLLFTQFTLVANHFPEDHVKGILNALGEQEDFGKLKFINFAFDSRHAGRFIEMVKKASECNT